MREFVIGTNEAYQYIIQAYTGYFEDTPVYTGRMDTKERALMLGKQYHDLGYIVIVSLEIAFSQGTDDDSSQDYNS